MNDSPGMRARAAEVLADHCEVPLPWMRGHIQVQQTDVIDAMLAFAQSPEQQGEGMVLVPREPTEAMYLAGANVCSTNPHTIWAAMLASAPPIPDVQDGGERT